jgi:hypothetical protein
MLVVAPLVEFNCRMLARHTQFLAEFDNTKHVLHVGLFAPFGGSWPQVLTHSSSSFRSQAMQPPPPAQGLHQKAALGAVETMEEMMQLLSIIELMRLSKIELCDLAARITNEFPDFPERSDERLNAVTNLSNIRAMLARRDFSP